MSELAGDSAASAAFERMRAAMAVTDVSGTEKSVLLVLAIMANEADQAWPPISGPNGLTAKCSLGERTVQRAIQALVDAKHISRLVRPGRGVVYTVHPRHSGTPATAAPPPEQRPVTETPTPATAAPKQPITTKPQKASPSSGKRERKAPARSAVETLPDLPEDVTTEQWNDYVEMRKAMAKGSKARPWTPGAAKNAIRELHRLAEDGHPPGKVLEQSTLNGWQGLFPLKDDRRGQRNHSGERKFRDPLNQRDWETGGFHPVVD